MSRTIPLARRLVLVAAAAFAVNPTMALHAQEGRVAEYTGGGTVVVKVGSGAPLVDTGVLVCQPASSSGIGGACLPFGGGDSVEVNDTVAGREVAFQVCLDNNGDGRCVSPDFGPCGDDIFFSHDDRGTFFNPLGKLPLGFRTGCPGGPFKGYVVFLCEGVHDPGSDTGAPSTPHTHTVRNGVMRVIDGGTGFGNFCGGSRQSPSNKAYIVR